MVSCMFSLQPIQSREGFLENHQFAVAGNDAKVLCSVATGGFVCVQDLINNHTLTKGTCLWCHHADLWSVCSKYLAGWWFGTFFIFPYIGLLIIPIDFHIFQRGSNHPPVCDRLGPGHSYQRKVWSRVSGPKSVLGFASKGGSFIFERLGGWWWISWETNWWRGDLYDAAKLLVCLAGFLGL